VWIDVLSSFPDIGDYAYFNVGYVNQETNGELRDLGGNGSWYVAPTNGAIVAPGVMSVGQTFGDTYDDGFDTGVETYQVVQGGVGVQTPASPGNFETFRVLYSDMPVPGDPRGWTSTSTEWYSPGVGSTIQSLGQDDDDVSNSSFLWADQLVDYFNVPGTEDSDGDGVPDLTDNCPYWTTDPDQTDANSNGIGDICDVFFGKPRPPLNPARLPPHLRGLLP